MPILKIVGSSGIKITKEQAIEIRKMKWGINGGNPTASPTEGITIDGLGSFQVKDVRNILNDDRDSNMNKAIEDRMENQKSKQEEIDSYRVRIKTWSSFKKAERMLKTYCYLCYRANGGVGRARDVMMKDPIFSLLMKPLVEYFENNPKEHHAPREVYEKLLKSGEPAKKVADGWQSVGQAIR